MNSKDLKDKMAEAGVVGPPDVFFYHVAKQSGLLLAAGWKASSFI
jgi:hypothetical protein